MRIYTDRDCPDLLEADVTVTYGFDKGHYRHSLFVVGVDDNYQGAIETTLGELRTALRFEQRHRQQVKARVYCRDMSPAVLQAILQYGNCESSNGNMVNVTIAA